MHGREVTLAIGDGANDVSMIQVSILNRCQCVSLFLTSLIIKKAAHIGVGKKLKLKIRFVFL